MAESLKAALVDIGGTLWPNSWPVRATDGEGRLARLRALLRRDVGERPVVLRAGELRLNPATKMVRRLQTPIALSAKEFALLEFFMRHKGEVLSRTQILDHVWDFAYDGTSNVVEVYIRYLREKVDRPFGRHSIETVRGSGYRLRADGG